jgi:hypothetical protein
MNPSSRIDRIRTLPLVCKRSYDPFTSVYGEHARGILTKELKDAREESPLRSRPVLEIERGRLGKGSPFFLIS